LDIAHFYDLQHVLDKCDACLQKDPDVTLSEKLVKAEKFGLKRTLDDCKDKLRTTKALKSLYKEDHYQELSTELKIELLESPFTNPEMLYVLNTDMDHEQVRNVIGLVRKADARNENVLTAAFLATFLKSEMDIQFGFNWHCVVGQSFAFSIRHDQHVGGYMFLNLRNWHILLFKSG
jgi:hypothetical protein